MSVQHLQIQTQDDKNQISTLLSIIDPLSVLDFFLYFIGDHVSS